MKDLKPTIPGFDKIYDFYKSSPNQPGKFDSLGNLLSGLLNIIFYIAVFLTFYYLVWGALSYIMAQGQKENLSKARSRITWALVGLMVTLLSFSIAKFAAEIFQPTGGVPF